MDYFYDGQLKRYLTQFMRVLSNFGYKNSKGQVTRVPVMYGDMNRQVAQILRKNSENAIPSAPFIACYIKDVQYDITRLQDPTFISKVNIREREYDANGNQYLNTQGANYTVERIMPSPFTLTLNADMWFTNVDQKMQIWEQMMVLFNPSLEIQTSDNYIDWTSLSVLTLDNQIWSSRSVPQGVEQDIDILTLTFKAPIWITPPAKVKKLGIVTKIIANIFAVTNEEIQTDFTNPDLVPIMGNPDATVVITPEQFELLVMDNVASLVKYPVQAPNADQGVHGKENSWLRILDLYPGKFRAGLSQLRLKKPDGNEIVAYISIDPNDETKMALNFDSDTIPSNTIINGRGTVDAIINPETFNPGTPTTGTRYLILERINVNSATDDPGYSGPAAWKNSNGSDFSANANDIIEWDGSAWNVIFNSVATNQITYITNSYTGIQYKWSNGEWSKSFEGIYEPLLWRLVL